MMIAATAASTSRILLTTDASADFDQLTGVRAEVLTLPWSGATRRRPWTGASSWWSPAPSSRRAWSQQIHDAKVEPGLRAAAPRLIVKRVTLESITASTASAVLPAPSGRVPQL